MDELLTNLAVAAAAKTTDYGGRKGFDENFLGQHVPLPGLAGSETVLLPSTHFSVLMRSDKRLAAVTAVGIDGEKLVDLDRAGIP
jgi:endonuclease G